MSCTVLTVLQLYTILRTSIAGIIHVIQTRAAPWYSDVLDVLHPLRISSESCCHVSFLRAFKTPDLVPSGLPSFLAPQFMEASHVPCVGSRTLWGRASRANNMAKVAKVAKAEVCVDTAV